MGIERVRIRSIEISDFKNVEKGSIAFSSKKGDFSGADMIALYGQNGSGKTALIDALSILKMVLTGESLPNHFINYISIDKPSSCFTFVFEINLSDVLFEVKYSFDLTRRVAFGKEELKYSSEQKNVYATIENEVLMMSGIIDSKKVRMHTVIDSSSTEEVFIPRTKFELLMGKDSEQNKKLVIFKELARERAVSFIFSKEFFFAMEKRCKVREYIAVLNALIGYGHFYLYVVDTQSAGLINLNAALPLFFRKEDNQSLSSGTVPIDLQGTSVIPVEVCEVVQGVITEMNLVLEQIIPGLNIELKNLGPALLKNGREGCIVELVSKRDGVSFPLKYESEGIKRIISVLHLMIAMYNDDRITVAIDELDSGIFEFLLGELLKIISEGGKGQLIFTSHNLRPLELIDKKYVFFTTTNPKNRYIQMGSVQTNNNLRQFYYRNILVGGQKEELYHTTNHYSIRSAFMEAGERNG